MDVRTAARSEGFELDEKPLDGRWVCAWHHGDDWRWPCYFEERHALSWMPDRTTGSGRYATRGKAFESARARS
jgi:hypothetical protein